MRDLHAGDTGPLQQMIGEMRERCGIASVLAAAGEFGNGCGMLVADWIVTQPLVMLQADALDQNVPEIVVPELAFGMGAQPRLRQLSVKDVILVVQVRSIGKSSIIPSRCAMPSLPCQVIRNPRLEVDGLAFARSRPADQDQNIESAFRPGEIFLNKLVTSQVLRAAIHLFVGPRLRLIGKWPVTPG